MAVAEILYYSLSGTTHTLATAVATALGGTLIEIRCARYRPGPWSYLRAGYDSLRGNLPEITLSQPVHADADILVLAAPIWTSYPAVPLRAFLATRPVLPERIGLVLTHGAHSPPEKTIRETQALLPVTLAATLTMHDKDVVAKDYADAVAHFVATLTGSDA